ncbi:pH-response regulator protein palF/RIM8 [Magnaporthiopsis poae ATCC 64411]|uniref:pH-response regulator protein palF/RIM8 n=1 Tax=Magnaporthiopsis poae (strain ATCC 64411 / 73-15) TaxID=644358 RepID=A0A0C4E2W8_MAGP6|nr:pH-response regulator protein palF/RIM8 [Magnaporthiopsis poae ATCC 64411]
MGANSASRHRPPSLEDTPSGRSFFSRISLLSRSRTRHINDFYIRPAEPHRKYAAGDHVTGAVFLTVLKPIRITHLTVTLHGFVKVFKSPNAAHDPPVNPALVESGITGRIRYFGNGHASLFQDEQVLSADGKLEAGRYEFNFDLVFPSKGLPSSIDFERGTISYVITATLTRPNTISPTITCERKVCLVEQVDIGTLALPRPRTISLEPISKRPKRRRPERLPGHDRVSIAVSDTNDVAQSDLESSREPESVADGSAIAAREATGQDLRSVPRSPTRIDIPDMTSEVSVDTTMTGSTGAGYRISDPATSSSSAGSQVGARTPTPDEKTITANIEMLKGGFLPGDFIPVKVCVHHIKRIKSVHGVIATLYRQGRIDSAPPISLFTDLSKEEIRRLEKEEYFPRSKTGLSGLSLSSAGSCSVFRKDLSQAFGPLIIDPVSLEASVTISVRVPEDVFPTIKGVPGELISFKYQLEVIVDLGGKLASQIQSGQGGPSGAPTPVAAIRNPYEHGSSMPMGQWGASIIDTDQLRRLKGVISVVFEVPVGTLDSSRQRTRGSLRPKLEREQAYDPRPLPAQPMVAVVYGPDEKRRATEDEVAEESYSNHRGDGPALPIVNEYAPSPHYMTRDLQSHPAPVYIPPPDVPAEAELSEKERIRRAEQRLLPSQPPAAESSSAAAAAAAAPAEDDLYNAEDQNHWQDVAVAPGPSAPTLEDLEPGATSGSGEDKLERERQRLLAEASAPPEFPEDYDAGPSAPPISATAPVLELEVEPSAPVFAEDDEFGYGSSYAYNEGAFPSHRGHHTSHLARAVTAPVEPLPRYQR